MKYANLALLILFPIAWFAPLLRAALLPIFGMDEISVVSGLQSLWQTDAALGLVVTVFAIFAPFAKTAGLALVQFGLLSRKTLPALHRIAGYKGSHFMRRTLDSGEVEFMEITYWDSMDTIIAFAGEDCTRAVVPLDTQAFLTRFDDRSVHFEATWCP